VVDMDESGLEPRPSARATSSGATAAVKKGAQVRVSSQGKKGKTSKRPAAKGTKRSTR
jgi:hypothetical protein